MNSHFSVSFRLRSDRTQTNVDTSSSTLSGDRELPAKHSTRHNMTGLIAQIIDNYNYCVYDQEDERVKDWFLMGSPVKVIGIILMYIYIVKVGGPKFMKDREPYDFKKTIAAYNIIQILANAALFYGILTSGWTDELSLGCEPVDYSYAPKPYRLATMFWYALMLKIFDHIETYFFVLRKKNNQVSLLHVYHHVVTLSLTWITCKWFAGGMVSFSGLPNPLVHIIMYTYYLLALFGPRMQKRIHGFKKCITVIQLVQFCLIIIHAMQAVSPSCQIPNFLVIITIPNIAIFFYMFYNFYKNTYKPKVHQK